MDSEQLKIQIGHNIAAHRKRCGLTQAELAQRLNYSDKAVSKWERGESAPDVVTLVALAERFQITVSELVSDPNELPKDTGAVQQTMGKVVERALKRKADKNIILLLSSLLVWFVALLIFVVVTSLDLPYGWMAFLFAVPADAIVMLSLRSAWRDFRWNRFLISTIMWGSLLCIFTTLGIIFKWYWLIFLLGIPGQAAILLWFRLFRTPREDDDGQETTA